MPQTTLLPLGDRALTIAVLDGDGVPVRDVVRALTARLRADAQPAITALVPAIETLTVHYEPLRTTMPALEAYLAHVLQTLVITPPEVRAPVVIPVCYGGEFGPDLEFVATHHGTTPDEIVRAHTAGAYTVAMLGFLPGFPYLEGLEPQLHTPRRASPRTSVPAGSVGIGGGSTGVYPFTSPGGWHLVGRTPRTLFDATRTPPALLSPGDAVRFEAVSADAFTRLRA